MKIRYDYYTETIGFPEVHISKKQALEICERFGIDDAELKLHDPHDGEIQCSESVRVWTEEAMNYKQ